MITTKINNFELKMYDSIDNMPIVNFQMFNRFLLIDSGIGSEFTDIDTHITKIAKFVQTDKKLALQELQNMRQLMYMISQGINAKHMSFACFIHSINGEEFTDLTDSGVKTIIDKLNKIPKNIFSSLLDELKKKIDTELGLYFSGFFDSAKEKEAYDMLRQRTILVLESIINDKNNADAIDTIDTSLLNLSKPKSYNGNKSIEVLYNKQFEAACILITQQLNTNAKKMTVFEFYTAFEQLKKQKPQSKSKQR